MYIQSSRSHIEWRGIHWLIRLLNSDTAASAHYKTVVNRSGATNEAALTRVFTRILQVLYKHCKIHTSSHPFCILFLSLSLSSHSVSGKSRAIPTGLYYCLFFLIFSPFAFRSRSSWRCNGKPGHVTILMKGCTHPCHDEPDFLVLLFLTTRALFFFLSSFLYVTMNIYNSRMKRTPWSFNWFRCTAENNGQKNLRKFARYSFFFFFIS